MNQKISSFFKKLLSKILPNSDRIRYLSYLPKLQEWIRKHPEPYLVFKNRHEVYDYINHTVLSNPTITYLEFGVREGNSMKYWLTLNQKQESKFFGFDTFTGIPESWNSFGTTPQNTFSAEGKLPSITDERASFIQGLFQETLANFIEKQPIQTQLVIHNDSDLYSATLFVLTKLNGIITPGTIIIFDEFSSMLHEFRTLEDYCNAYMRQYKVLAVTKSSHDYYSQIAIQVL